MSLNNFKNFPKINEDPPQSKPIYRILTSNNELNVDSKKMPNSIDIEQYRKGNKNFDLKNFDLSNLNFKSNIFLKNKLPSKSFRNESFDSMNDPPSEIVRQEKRLPKNNKRNKSPSNLNHSNISGNKKKNQGNRNKRNKNNKRNQSKNTNKNSSIYSANDFTSKRSKSSANSTKRSKYNKAHESPDKYSDDYLSVDSSSNEEVKNNGGDNMEKNLNNNSNKNNRNKFSYLNKIISEKENSWKNKEIKEEMEQKLEGFDLVTVDIKSMFRDLDFQKKYLRNLKADIKIVYFDKEQIPLHAIFVFCSKDGVTIGKEKKIFPGAFDKNEFIQFSEKLIKKKSMATVELLADFADMNKNNYMNWMKVNKNLFIDFYFLIDIIN